LTVVPIRPLARSEARITAADLVGHRLDRGQAKPGQEDSRAVLRKCTGHRRADGSRGAVAGLFVITLADERICALTRFESSCLPWFDLPRSLPSA